MRSKNEGTRILAYHSIGGKPQDHRLRIRVREESFREQVDELVRQGYVTMTVSELIENGPMAVAGKAIVLSFDDGYKDNITEAASELKARGMRATFFVTASNINGNSLKTWADGAKRAYMDWADVASLGRMGFEIGSHMVDHIRLTDLGDEEALYQLAASKREILEKAGIEPKTFSHPYGGADDKIAGLAKRAGYIGGCSLMKGLNIKTTDPYLLRRTEVGGDDTMDDFRAKLKGYHD